MKLKELMEFIDGTDWTSNAQEVKIVVSDAAHQAGIRDATATTRYAVQSCQINLAGELEILVA